MLAKTHIQAGYTCSLLVFPVFIQNPNSPQIFPYLSCVGGIMLGTLLVDIDSKNSVISRMIPFRQYFGRDRGANHRSWVHTLFFLIIYTMISLLLGKLYINPFSKYLYYLFYCFTLGCNVGMFSHLCLDTLNPTGIAWFYPLNKKKYRFIGIRTESYVENKFGKKQKTKGEGKARTILKVLNSILLIIILLNFIY